MKFFLILNLTNLLIFIFLKIMSLHSIYTHKAYMQFYKIILYFSKQLFKPISVPLKLAKLFYIY